MRRLHPFSAVSRGLGGVVQGGAAGFFIGTAAGQALGIGGPLVPLLAPLLALIAGGFGVAGYYRFGYDVSGDTLTVVSGVFDRQERDIPLGRIQNVDVRRGGLQRALGLAVVRFETAGGGSTEAELNVVTLSEARRLQEVVGAARREDTSEGAADADVAGEAGETRTSTGDAGPSEETLYELSEADLARLSAVSVRPAAPAFVLFTTPIVGDLARRVLSASVQAVGGPPVTSLEVLSTYGPSQVGLIAAVALVQFVAASLVVSAALTAVRYYGFRLSRVGDELRYERGLVGRYSGSIPLGKVQTVTVRENAAMRRVGLAALDVETAGYGPGSDDEANTAIPIDDRGTVLALARRLGEVDYPEVERPPKRSRRRYAVRFSIAPLVLTGIALAADRLLAVPGTEFWFVPLAALPLAPVAAHLRWTNRGYALTEAAFVARSGFWSRHSRIVPYYRVQTVISTRSAFQRFRDLATVTGDTASTASVVGGDATAYDVDESTARRIERTLRDRLTEDLARRKRERRERRERLTSGRGDPMPADGTGRDFEWTAAGRDDGDRTGEDRPKAGDDGSGPDAGDDRPKVGDEGSDPDAGEERPKTGDESPDSDQ